MIRRIKLHWDVPELARLGWKGSLTVRFYILADGTVADAKILHVSGVPPFDNAAFQAIIKSSPFRPLPEDLHEEREGVTITFFYNMRVEQEGAEGEAVNDSGQIRAALESAEYRGGRRLLAESLRPSNEIARYLQRQGYRVVPINPGHREVLGEPCFPSLAAVPDSIRIDIVDVFRRSEFVADVAAQAIARKVPFLFMQLGVVDDVSARRLEAAGIGCRDGPLHPGRAPQARDPPKSRNAGGRSPALLPCPATGYDC